MVVRVRPLSVSIIETCAPGNAAPVESNTVPPTSATATACEKAGTANKEIVNKQSIDKAAKSFMEDPHLSVPQCEILYRCTRFGENLHRRVGRVNFCSAVRRCDVYVHLKDLNGIFGNPKRSWTQDNLKSS